MTDIQKAISLLKNSKHTCVVCKDDTEYISDLKGIAPMIEFMKNGYDLCGASVADRIVGRAAAMLFVKAGIKEAFCEVVSKDAVKLLNTHGINCSWDVITDMIINRKGDGPCPMEKAVCGLDDDEIELGYDNIVQTLDELRSNQKSHS